MYTSLNLSKKLKEKCKLPFNKCWWEQKFKSEVSQDKNRMTENCGISFTGESSCFGLDDKTQYKDTKKVKHYPAYDILWDICVKYYDIFFNIKRPKELIAVYEECKDCLDLGYPRRVCKKCSEKDLEYSIKLREYKRHYVEIIDLILKGESQEKIENYIWKHCLFNPKNKGGK